MGSIFKAYDIRGIYDKDLTKKIAFLIGYNLINLLSIKKIRIAHDKRNSYEDLTKYLIGGILKAGASVDYLGISSTPNFYFSLNLSENEEDKTGIMVTASHNPKEFNGFKIIYNGKSFDSQNEKYKKLELLVENPTSFLNKSFEEFENKYDKFSLIQFIQDKEIKYNSKLEDYTQFLFSFYENKLTFEEKKILESKNIMLDFSSGVSSLALVGFLKQTSLNFDFVNYIVDGNFPNHPPDPSKAQSFIKNLNTNFDIGFVFDGDGDRIRVVDESKNIILFDYPIALLIDFFSTNFNKKEFVTDLRISRIVNDLAIKNKFKLDLLRVGRAFYQEYMEKNKIFFGAELSGHLFFEEFNYFDNPDIALIYFLKIYAHYLLNKNDIKFSEIIEKYIVYYKEHEINIEVKDKQKAMNNVLNKYEEYLENKIDGFSFNLGDVWFNIRPSNTEDLLRINIEGKNKKVVEMELDNLKKILLN